MIYPTRFAVMLAAAGAPLALLLGIVAPGLWLAGPAWIIFIAALMLADSFAGGSRQRLQTVVGEMHPLAVGVPAGDRMDWLVEKATELGAASVWPLITQRAVLRLHGERAIKKVRHWQAVAIAACEQCGRNQVPVVHPIVDLASWLVALAPPSPAALRCLLAPGASAQSLTQLQARLHEQAAPAVWALSGPEGGLTGQEEEVARQKGFVAVNLGPRVLRAETAPLALLAHLTLTA